MRVCSATRKIVRLNLRRPPNNRALFIHVFPYVVDSVVHPVSIVQDAEQLVMFTGVSIVAQVTTVLYGVAHKKYFDTIK